MAQQGGQESRIPWHRLRAWIDQQEAFEERYNRAAVLNQQQVTAIGSLIPLFEEKQVQEDYVSLLNLYHQTRHSVTLPSFTDESVTMDLGGVKQLRWRCYCTVPSQDGQFPRLGYGIDVIRGAPTFQTKKLAKQFAAKQAYLFLKNGEASTAYRTRSGTTSSPPKKKYKTDEASTSSFGSNIGTGSGSVSGSVSGNKASVPHQGPSSLPSSSSSPFPRSPSSKSPQHGDYTSINNGSPASIYEQISSICRSISVPCPSYILEPDGDVRHNLWCGRPDFQGHAAPPLDLGVVSGILTKKQAKLAIAEEVLAWAQNVERERNEKLQEMLASLGEPINVDK